MVKTIYPTEIAQADLHHYLLSAVAPRPICFASTINAQGQVNLSPFSFFNVFSSNPPVMIFSPARSGRDNTTKHSLDNVLEVGEVSINIVNHPIVEQMSLASTAYAKGINEFDKAGLTAVASDKIGPPRVGEAPVSFECTVQEVIALGDQGGAGNLVIARVELIHIREEYLKSDGFLDTEKLDLVARMGESWYCRASGDALFQIPKPLRTRGIGVDQLPEKVRHSDIFTGNDLGRLGNVESLPDTEMMKEIEQRDEVKQLIAQNMASGLPIAPELHKLAKTFLANGQTADALALAILSKEY